MCIEDAQKDGKRLVAFSFSYLGMFLTFLKGDFRRGIERDKERTTQEERVCGGKVETVDEDIAMTCSTVLSAIEPFQPTFGEYPI